MKKEFIEEALKDFDSKFGDSAPEVAFKDWEKCDSVRLFLQQKLEEARGNTLEEALIKCPCEKGDCSLCEYLCGEMDKLQSLTHKE